MACGGYVMRQDKKSIAFTEVDIDFRDMRSGYITKHSIKRKIFHNYLIISNHSRYTITDLLHKQLFILLRSKMMRF